MSVTRAKTTHTYALLPVSQESYDEIATLLRAAGYDHAFADDGAIDLHGLALVVNTEKPSPAIQGGVA